MPTEEPIFFVPQKFVKRPYYRLVYFNRPSSTFYIQEPIPSYGENESGWPDGKVGFEPTSFRPTKTERFDHLSFLPNILEKLMVTFTIFDLSLSLSFFRFFWEISSWSNVNLVLNHTILSFKAKKLLTTYLSPLIFLNHKKQTHKLNSQKTTRASGWIRTNVTFRFLITNQVQSTSMRRKPVAEYFF